MALAAAARSRRLCDRLFRRLHPALPHLLNHHCSGDDSPTPSPLRPPPRSRSPHFPLPQPSRAAQTLPLFPFGAHIAGAGLPRRGFSSLPSYGVADASTVLTDVADAAAAAPASFPSEVTWAAEDSSLSVEALQHLIDAVHSFTGLNWCLSIALSTVLLRCALFPLSLQARKQISVVQAELSAATELIDSANDEKSKLEAIQRAKSLLKRLGLPAFIMILTPYTFVALYFAMSNMVEKLPSLKVGGVFWFTDLTTPDALYIFPVMTSLSLMLRLEFSLHYLRTARSHKMEADIVRILLILPFPLIASLPQAICCYLVTWSFASLTQLIVLNQPIMKKLLYGERTKPVCPSSDEPNSPAADDSPSPTEEHEQSLPPERRTDQSNEKSEKDS